MFTIVIFDSYSSSTKQIAIVIGPGVKIKEDTNGIVAVDGHPVKGSFAEIVAKIKQENRVTENASTYEKEEIKQKFRR